MSDSLRILVTNDDGIHAPGLAVAEKIARTLSDDVWVVAPDAEQSGASHSLTLTRPLRLRRIDERRFAVSGTPTDCVMIATTHLMEGAQPTLLLSGVNSGINAADDVTYSGTIAGAMEGCALDIPSIALSQSYNSHDRREIPWDCAATHGPALVKRLLDIGWPQGVLMNVNFPDCPAGEVEGVEIARQGKRDLQEAVIDKRVDMRGVPYFWIGFRRERWSKDEGTDLGALSRKRISVTPLHLDLTEKTVLEDLRRSFAG
jgi:5'-nucleotidase